VFQAFQINIRYKSETKYNNTFLETTHIVINKNCQFKSIGTDETGIPIVVTRVGLETAKYKIIIAGPHGDERNAQRLIMSAQKILPCTLFPVLARQWPLQTQGGYRL